MREFETGATRDQIELAWAAGFYDGEGSISCTSNNGNPFTRVQLSIGQKNDGDAIATVLTRFQKAVGVGKIYRKTRIGREIDQHQYIVCDKKGVQKVIHALWPYLSPVKKRQIDVAVALLASGQATLIEKQKGAKTHENV